MRQPLKQMEKLKHQKAIDTKTDQSPARNQDTASFSNHGYEQLRNLI